MFNSNSFIAPFNPTDCALVFVDTKGNRVRGMNVCRYLNFGIDKNIIWILLEGNEKIVLDFASTLDANSASTLLKNAIDSLILNCPVGGSGGPPIPPGTLSIIPVTLTQYQALKAAGTLTDTLPADRVQWYDVSDTENILGEGIGAIYRVLALHPTDGLPQGFCLNTLKWGTIDIDAGKIINTYYNFKYEHALNNSRITNLNGSSCLFAANHSSLSCRNNPSTNITLFNSSALLDNCNNVYIVNCSSLILQGVTNCFFENISGDYTAYTLSNIKVNSFDTIGKLGFRTFGSIKSNLTAYIDEVWQKPASDTIVAALTLKQIFPDANATFKILLGDKFTGTINIYDFSSSNLILAINSTHAGLTITFIYDKLTGRFFLEKSSNWNLKSEKLIFATIDGQTFFPNILDYIPKNPSLSLMFINGQQQIYDMDYIIDGKNITWISTDFILQTTDIINIFYE